MAAMRAPETLDAHRARKADARTEASDLRLELQARGDEAIGLCDSLAPVLRRLDYFAKEHGPAAQAVVHELAYRVARFRAQWTPEPEDGAA